MTLTITANKPIFNDGTSQSVENLTGSTATTLVSLSILTDVSSLGMCTATGFTLNRYILPAAPHGQNKWIICQATGEAYVQLTGGTATGALVFTATSQRIQCAYMDTGWILTANTGATIATATAAA